MVLRTTAISNTTEKTTIDLFAYTCYAYGCNVRIKTMYISIGFLLFFFIGLPFLMGILAVIVDMFSANPYYPEPDTNEYGEYKS
jgi:hypothetical protein